MASLSRYWQRKAAILFVKRMSSYCRLQALVNKLNRNSGTGVTCFLRDATQRKVILSSRASGKFTGCEQNFPRLLHILHGTLFVFGKLSNTFLRRRTCLKLKNPRENPPVMMDLN